MNRFDFCHKNRLKVQISHKKAAVEPLFFCISCIFNYNLHFLLQLGYPPFYKFHLLSIYNPSNLTSHSSSLITHLIIQLIINTLYHYSSSPSLITHYSSLVIIITHHTLISYLSSYLQTWDRLRFLTLNRLFNNLRHALFGDTQNVSSKGAVINLRNSRGWRQIFCHKEGILNEEIYNSQLSIPQTLYLFNFDDLLTICLEFSQNCCQVCLYRDITITSCFLPLVITCSFLVLTCSTAPHTFDNNRWFRGLMAGNQNASGNRYKEGSASPIKRDSGKSSPSPPTGRLPSPRPSQGTLFLSSLGLDSRDMWLTRCSAAQFWPFFSIYFSHGRITNRAFFAAINLETIITTTTNREENKQMMSKLNREEYRLTKRNDSRAQAKNHSNQAASRNQYHTPERVSGPNPSLATSREVCEIEAYYDPSGCGGRAAEKNSQYINPYHHPIPGLIIISTDGWPYHHIQSYLTTVKRAQPGILLLVVRGSTIMRELVSARYVSVKTVSNKHGGGAHNLQHHRDAQNRAQKKIQNEFKKANPVYSLKDSRPFPTCAHPSRRVWRAQRPSHSTFSPVLNLQPRDSFPNHCGTSEKAGQRSFEGDCCRCKVSARLNNFISYTRSKRRLMSDEHQLTHATKRINMVRTDDFFTLSGHSLKGLDTKQKRDLTKKRVTTFHTNFFQEGDTSPTHEELQGLAETL
ncbi:hypothetical protein VP01_2963g1 [Puccinia sorghi]|uniref:Uncharacterized protein n=1 Tax=Puccinia sorghi TaxID=27349 RepID=A0A0L6V0R5_9BASI|nr:hypothetical protein VP01_2963g1 [Puccinia sorghi]